MVTHLLVTGTDITDRLAAEARATERRLKLDAALSCGRLGCWEWDPQSDRNEMDPTARTLWGYTPDEPTSGSATLARIHPDDRPQVERALQRVITGGVDSLFDERFRVVLPDGRERLIAGRGGGLRNADGGLRAIFGVNWAIKPPDA